MFPQDKEWWRLSPSIVFAQQQAAVVRAHTVIALVQGTSPCMRQHLERHHRRSLVFMGVLRKGPESIVAAS